MVIKKKQELLKWMLPKALLNFNALDKIKIPETNFQVTSTGSLAQQTNRIQLIQIALEVCFRMKWIKILKCQFPSICQGGLQGAHECRFSSPHLLSTCSSVTSFCNLYQLAVKERGHRKVIKYSSWHIFYPWRCPGISGVLFAFFPEGV